IRRLDHVVLEVAAGDQHARRVRGEVGMLTLDPGARAIPRIREGVGLAGLLGEGDVGVAASPAEQHSDLMPPGAHPFLHGLTSCDGRGWMERRRSGYGVGAAGPVFSGGVSGRTRSGPASSSSMRGGARW